MDNKKRKKYGFTLIELLATIVVLALVMGISIYVAINIIGDSKDNSYQVTINNIEKIANNYLIENNDRLSYVVKDDNIEYQCVTIQELIEYGYFNEKILDSDVSDDRKVLKTDNIYLERNINTKNVELVKYLYKEEDIGLCSENKIESDGNTYIDIYPSIDEYSTYKDITIRYTLKNYQNINDYKYEYSYSNANYLEVISDNGNVKKLRVTDNGEIRAWITNTNDNRRLGETSKIIDKIDTEPPVIKLSDITKIYGVSFDLYEGVTITDNSGEVASKKIYLGNKEITSYKELSVGDNVVTYKAVDKFGYEKEVIRKIKIVVASKEFNYAEKDQIYEILADGTYIIEVYGAQGGNSGGKGGYVKAEVALKAGNKLVINTGGVNGYNGGGGYRNGSYYPGGGSSTVRYNNSYIVIAGGGGARGSEGTPGAGGTGNGAGGGAPTNGRAGLSGTNGGGGSNSNNSSYSCNCVTRYCTSRWCRYYNTFLECDYWYDPCGTSCSTCTGKGKSGSGGRNKVVSPAISVSTISGDRAGNGYAKVSYKLED